MPGDTIHRFERNGTRFAIDPETCFCFECDAISWDVLAYYPETPVNRIYHELGDRHDVKELAEVVGELEWLRASKSIAAQPKPEDLQKQLATSRSLQRLVVRLPRGEDAPAARTRPSLRQAWFRREAAASSESVGARELGREAIGLLLSRAGDQEQLEIEFLEAHFVHQVETIAELCSYALRCGERAGKKLLASVRVEEIAPSGFPPALRDHTLAARLEFDASAAPADILRCLATLSKAVSESLSRLVKAVQPGVQGTTGRLIVRPNSPDFAGAVEELFKVELFAMELDMDGAFVSHPDIDPKIMLKGLSQAAEFYAQRLLEGRYFRLDPIASTFWRIYEGRPLHRADPAGAHELAVDHVGGIYPSGRMMGMEAFRLGSVFESGLNEDILSRFDSVGSQYTSECRRCWARSLCGGGCAMVHHTLSGSFRSPNLAWCDAQRDWMADAVSAFTALSSHGVNFTRVYHSLGRSAKPSLFTMLRAAFRMTIGMRPIEEADAERLVRWENWNESAYFVCNESSLLVATKYDREMDSLHPTGIDQEMMLVRKNGEPMGLFKFRPELVSGAAQGWLYLRNEADYEADDVRKGIRAILKEAGSNQAMRRLTILATPRELSLQKCLEWIGFAREGIVREGLYMHGAYHDVYVYGISLDRL